MFQQDKKIDIQSEIDKKEPKNPLVDDTLHQSEQNEIYKSLKEIDIFKAGNEGECCLKKVICLEFSIFKLIFHGILTICTAGLLYILCHNYQGLYRFFFFSKCSVKKATHFLAKNFDNEYELQKKIKGFKDQDNKERIAFENRYMRYIFGENTEKFKSFGLQLERLTNQQVKQLQPLSQEECERRKKIFGECLIDFPVTKYYQFAYYFLTKPQLLLVYLSFVIWVIEGLYVFACVLLLVTLIVMTFLFFFNRSQKRKILAKAKKITKVQRIQKNREIQTIDSNLLVPGDFILIEHSSFVPCDLVLIEGQCFVNEANITGEPDPVPKLSLKTQKNNQVQFSYQQNFVSVIYEGTQIINSQNSQNSFQFEKSFETPQNGEKFGQNFEKFAVGLVARTGFSTKKGQVIRTSLFPAKKMSFFEADLLKFLVFFICLGVVAFCIQAKFLFDDEDIPRVQIWIRLGECFVTFGAASLILLLFLTQITATNRLAKLNIQGTNPNQIQDAGQIQIVCYDKTGTITENDIEFNGIWFSNTDNFSKKQELLQNRSLFGNQSHVEKLLATCHSAQPNLQNQEEIIGDAIDVQCFHLSKYSFFNYEEKSPKNIQNISHIFAVENENQEQILVRERLEFQSSNAYMLVTSTDLKSKLHQCYIKGSPEKIKGKFDKKSFDSLKYDQQIKKYTVQGYRVLAIGFYEESEYQGIEKYQYFERFQFLGFLVLENPLKKDSRECIQRIQEAQLAAKIISGDNSLTVTHTAAQVGIVVLNKPIYHFGIEEEKEFKQEKQLEKQQNQQEKQQNQQEKQHQQQEQNLKSGFIIRVEVQNGENFELKEFLDGQESFEFVRNLVSQAEIQICVNGSLLEFFQRQEFQNGENQQIQLLRRICLVSKLFARCTPELKRFIVQNLVQQDYRVAMIGDGANDCMAINEATIGISFASAEAALSSPFCSSEKSLICVEKILLEGRNTLEINFEFSHVYEQYMLTRYSLYMILIMYYQTIGDGQQNMPSYFAGVILQGLSVPFTSPAKTLSKFRYNYYLTSKRSVIGILGRWPVILALLLGVNFNVQEQDFYEETLPKQKDNELWKYGYENTALFLIFFFFSVSSIFYFYIGLPLKERIYKNYALTFLATVSTVLAIISADLIDLPKGYQGYLFLVCLGVFVWIFCWEKFVVQRYFLVDKKQIIPNLNISQNSQNKKI
ncbi:P-type ATPase, cytoplasmic domain N [Pseudocohnilembus persalinus]|uniref:P-type ATPase, cytoplasmic domain N n=1 Tax=Pseudocohnilembus persalinus TaxID=266149 RepID=A0A0V0QA88_PSEPJ|nr:P-type ATPase, cytoplasmic domain N [Pseudocohnilembus persalinus]|eukprot:KRW99089.1 P-type ATPase, cytoplasmic domain N [Pseudocohnilembus persalinus]